MHGLFYLCFSSLSRDQVPVSWVSGYYESHRKISQRDSNFALRRKGLVSYFQTYHHFTLTTVNYLLVFSICLYHMYKELLVMFGRLLTTDAVFILPRFCGCQHVSYYYNAFYMNDP